jgi:hypothetical protein
VPALPLAKDEASYLAAFLARVTGWDDRAAVRLQVRRGHVGCYAPSPLDVLAVVVLPLAGRGDDVDGVDEMDTTVSAGRLRDVIGDVALVGAVTDVTVPDPITGSPSLAVLPPVGPWAPGERGVAGDLLPRVAEAVAGFRASVPATGSFHADLVAEAAWDAPGWGGVPMRALHAAKLLGFLAHPGARVETGTSPGWKRLVTPGGQIFVRNATTPVRLSVVPVRE